MIKRISAKLGNMRKAQDFIVYPASKTASTPDELLIQSDKRICRFNTVTGLGILSVQRQNGAYGLDLDRKRGATMILVPGDVIAAAQAAHPKSGDEIGPGVTIA